MAGHAGEREEQVAELAARRLTVAGADGPGELVALLVDLGEDAGEIGPVESHLRELLADLRRAGEGGLSGRDAREDVRIGTGRPSLLGLDPPPVAHHLVGVMYMDIAKDMRMAPFQLVRDGARDVGEAEPSVLGRNFGVKQ